MSVEVYCYFDFMAVYRISETFRWVLEHNENPVVNDWSSYQLVQVARTHKSAVMFSFILTEWLRDTNLILEAIPEGSVEDQASRSDARYLFFLFFSTRRKKKTRKSARHRKEKVNSESQRFVTVRFDWLISFVIHLIMFFNQSKSDGKYPSK